MKVNLYTIYDVIAEESGPIFQAKNDLIACRVCDSLISEANLTAVSDLHLWCLGCFDTESRVFVPESSGGRLVDYLFGSVNSFVSDASEVKE